MTVMKIYTARIDGSRNVETCGCRGRGGLYLQEVATQERIARLARNFAIIVGGYLIGNIEIFNYKTREKNGKGSDKNEFKSNYSE